MGRREENTRLEALLDGARDGRGGALVLRGDPGIGKSALLERLSATASGFVILRASGTEFEMELPFAALHQLCGPVLEHRSALPAPHRRALEIAFGLDEGTPDPFLVGMATLGLLVNRQQPLLCVIDDAQWLDRASARTLAFLARRVAAEHVAVVFALREGGTPELDDLPTLTVRELSDTDARVLLDHAIRAPLDERVRDRILAEARGNPLALLELPETAGPAGMAGGFELPAPGAVEQSFRTRLRGLPPQARLLLTVAAAEPLGDPGLLWRAASLLGIEGAATAEAATLVEFGTRIRFSHPLARSAVYRTASADERRRAHAALAQAGDPAADPDRVAWHRAQASAGPDEKVAAELVRSATRARARGGEAAAAAFLERAAALTLDPGLRTERVLAAAEAKLAVGAFEEAAGLLSTLDADDSRADLLRGRVSFARYRGGDRPADHPLRAARRVAETDPARSREYYLDAVEMGVLLGGLEPVAAAALRAPAAPVPPSSADIVLDGVVALATRGHEIAADILRPVIRSIDDRVWAGRPSLGFILAGELWDHDSMRGIGGRVAAAARESGSLHMLPIGLAMLATSTVHAGDFGAAMEMIAEEEAIAEATGAAPLVYPRIHLAALRGRRAEAFELFAGTGPRMTLSVQWATAVLNNGLGDYPAALRAAGEAVAHGDLGICGLALAELIEAAVRSGSDETARDALASLRQRTRAGGHAWGLGVEAYSRALVHGDDDAYQEAISLLGSARLPVYQGRAHLLFGERLRRQGNRRDARAHLRQAHELLSDLGAKAFADRAAAELRATGEHARGRSSHPSDRLTVQEVHIARLVAEGATSKEVAAKLFLSPRTVDAHLRNIFRKLGLTSRRQLRDFPEIR